MSNSRSEKSPNYIKLEPDETDHHSSLSHSLPSPSGIKSNIERMQFWKKKKSASAANLFVPRDDERIIQITDQQSQDNPVAGKDNYKQTETRSSVEPRGYKRY